jgi:hypothetical protein
VNRFILYKDGALSAELCDQIVRRFEANRELRVGTTGAGLAPSVKKSTDLDISGTHDWKDVDDALRASLQQGVESYCEVNESLTSVNRLICTGLRLRRYDLGEFFDWHIDTFDGSVASRILACIWYLNDLDAGGETEFLYQEMKVKPKKGKLLLFPTSFEYVHRSNIVTHAAKYIVVGFIEHSPPTRGDIEFLGKRARW